MIDYEENDYESDDSEDDKQESVLIENLSKYNIVDQIKDNADAYNRIHTKYQEAVDSMEKWKIRYEAAINLAKMQPTSDGKPIEVKNFPIEGASLAMLPYLMEAAIDFSSRAAPELVWADDILAVKVYGKEIRAADIGAQSGVEIGQKELDQAVSDGKAARAERVAKYLNYQLKEEIPHWRDSQDKAILMLPIVGTVYKKTYFDYDEKVKRSDLVRADKVIFDMNSDNFEECRDIFETTTLTRSELLTMIRGHQKWDIDESTFINDKEKNEFPFILALSWVDIDDDDIDEPYYLILDEDSSKIVYACPAYDESTIHTNEEGQIVKITAVPCYTQYRFLPDPEGGPMGMGWGILLGPMFSAINATLRQQIDAGTVHLTSANSGLMASSIGGLGSGQRTDAGPIKLKIGEITPITTGSMAGTLKDNFVQFPFSGPSQVLFQLMDYLINSARSMTNASVNVDSHSGEAASLYLARLQQSLKVPNSVILRVFDAAKREARKIFRLNYKHHDSDAYNKFLDEARQYVMADDFNPHTCDIGIASNPAQGSDIERIAQAEAVLQLGMAQQAAGINVINIREATLDLLKATKTQDIQRLAPEPDPEAVDPTMKLMLAEKQMEAEMRQRDQMLREQQQRIQEQKLALEAAKQMTALGLQADQMEADITKKYMESLKIAWEMGMGITDVQKVERMFINQDSEGGVNGKPSPQVVNPPNRVMAE